MKVLIDLTSLNDNFSGIERYSLEITKKLLEIDSSNEYILLFKNQIHPSFLDCNAKKMIIKSNSKMKCNLLLVPKYIKKAKPDFVLYPAFPPSILSFFKKIKVLTVIHDLVCWDCAKTMKLKAKLYFRLGVKKALRISHMIITNSEFTKKRVMDKFSYPENKIIVAPCSSNIKENTVNNYYEVLEKYGIKKNNYLLTLSTIEPRKNIPFLLAAYNELCKTNDNVPDLVLVGRKGWKMNDLLTNIPTDTLEKIHFTGFVDDQDLPIIYEQSLLFVFTSIYEGFGIPVLEAIRMKKMVVVSNIPSNIELVGADYNYKFDFKYEDFIKCVLSASSVEESQRESIVNQLMERNDKYNWKTSAEEIYKVLNNN